MFFDRATYIGIDPTAGQRPFTYAALDQQLRLLALGEGNLDEVTAFAGGQRHAVVAINAPWQTNQGLMADPQLRERLQPPPRPGRWSGYRVAEYLLYQRKISIPPTPDDIIKCPRWMQMGFRVHQRLESFGYQRYPSDDAGMTVLETYPHGIFTELLGLSPFPKHTLEGRLQRQLALFDQNLNLPDPMRVFEEITRHKLRQGILPLEMLHTPQELDTLAAALVAWQVMNRPESIACYGDPVEGLVVLPVAR
jgi:hypothetical protein